MTTVNEFPEWAAFAGLASNLAFSEHERLGNALRAIELLEQELTKAREEAAPPVLEPKVYKTFAELKMAYDSGQLNEDNPLILDNDYVAVYAGDKEVFKAEYGMEDLLGLLEIPWERC